MSIERYDTGPHQPNMSKVVVHDGTVYLAGQLADDPKTSVTDQTKQILDIIDKRLASVGSDKSKVLSAVLYLSDMSKLADMNDVWNAWVDQDNLPARACVKADLTGPDYKVEIMVTAAL